MPGTRATLLRILYPPAFGLGTTLQLIPFQCSMRVWGRLLLLTKEYPTAQTFFAEMATTLSRTSLYPPGLGLAITVQLVPFQCSTSVCDVPLLLTAPTAQALFPEIAATPYRLLSCPGLGLTIAFHPPQFDMGETEATFSDLREVLGVGPTAYVITFVKPMRESPMTRMKIREKAVVNLSREE